ncbi:hypothetical protein DITRI_Ditri04bG0008800 [Diplodiscus trichospermus]
MLLRGMKPCSGLMSEPLIFSMIRPDMSGKRRRQNLGSDMREYQLLETDLNRRRDLTGKRTRIWVRRS